jgi:hypothetical protein
VNIRLTKETNGKRKELGLVRKKGSLSLNPVSVPGAKNKKERNCLPSLTPLKHNG